MTLVERPDVQKSQRFVVFVDEAGGNLFVDDFAENAGLSSCRVSCHLRIRSRAGLIAFFLLKTISRPYFN